MPAAIPWVRALAGARPEWIEEPTSPDDILGTAAIRQAVRPIRVATGEHVSNRVIFKQLLQADAIDIMQIDACRVAGIEVPSFCYYPGLALQAACRMCLVEIEKTPKLQTACTTPVSEGIIDPADNLIPL